MKILVVEPGKHPYAKEIKHELKEMQRIVDGPIQALYPYSDKVGVVCNDEAILLQKPFNRKIAEECYVTGTFFVCGLSRENFDSLSDDLLEKYRKMFYFPQIYTTSGVYDISPEHYRILMQRHRRDA